MPSPLVVATEFDAAIANWTSVRSGGPNVAVVQLDAVDIYFNDEVRPWLDTVGYAILKDEWRLPDMTAS